jgi:hypothetical protein
LERAGDFAGADGAEARKSDMKKPANYRGGNAQFGKGELRRKFASEKGGKTQEYFVYFKF